MSYASTVDSLLLLLKEGAYTPGCYIPEAVAFAALDAGFVRPYDLELEIKRGKVHIADLELTEKGLLEALAQMQGRQEGFPL